MMPARCPLMLAGTLPVTVTDGWFVAACAGASSTGETGTTASGLGDGAGSTAPAILETAPPTVDTIPGSAPDIVNRTTAPSATTATPSAAFAATGRPRRPSATRRAHSAAARRRGTAWPARGGEGRARRRCRRARRGRPVHDVRCAARDRVDRGRGRLQDRRRRAPGAVAEPAGGRPRLPGARPAGAGRHEPAVGDRDRQRPGEHQRTASWHHDPPLPHAPDEGAGPGPRGLVGRAAQLRDPRRGARAVAQ